MIVLIHRAHDSPVCIKEKEKAFFAIDVVEVELLLRLFRSILI